MILVGLTDSYLQYVTTPEEYALQHYEGASTLYGPHTAELLGNHLACLAPSLYAPGAPTACALGRTAMARGPLPPTWISSKTTAMPILGAAGP